MTDDGKPDETNGESPWSLYGDTAKPETSPLDLFAPVGAASEGTAPDGRGADREQKARERLREDGKSSMISPVTGLTEEAIPELSLTHAEAAELGATDTELFCRHFFPHVFRQASPEAGRELFDALDNPHEREIAFECFRGFGKTTRIRGYVAKRVSYAVSRTILIVSKAKDHAIRSVKWIKNEVEMNVDWTATFGLRKGAKWADDEITIVHDVEGVTITIVAVGITGQTRGLNVDNYRPDFIIVDDPNDAENTATPEQREKTSNEFFGSLQKSLAPPTEAPHALMALLQTPFDSEDIISTCRQSGWKVITIPCFDEDGNSTWEDRFPTEWLLKEKDKHAKRRDLSLWYREMECKVVAPENAAFDEGWLQVYDRTDQVPQKGVTVFAIDPASAETSTADRQVLLVIRVWEGHVWVVDYFGARGQDPEEFASRFFPMTAQWRALQGTVESIAYQRVLAWFLRKEMRNRMQWRTLHEKKGDRRSKEDRIIQTLRPVASNYCLHVRRDMTELMEEFSSYPDVKHDDFLDALALAVEFVSGLGGQVLEGDYEILEHDAPELEFRSAP